MQTNHPFKSIAWDERLPIEDGIHHADDDFAHLDEHLPAALVALLEFPSLQSLNAHTRKVYRCS